MFKWHYRCIYTFVRVPTDCECRLADRRACLRARLRTRERRWKTCPHVTFSLPCQLATFDVKTIFFFFLRAPAKSLFRRSDGEKENLTSPSSCHSSSFNLESLNYKLLKIRAWYASFFKNIFKLNRWQFFIKSQNVWLFKQRIWQRISCKFWQIWK